MYYEKMEHGKGDGESGKYSQYTGMFRADLSERVVIAERFERKGKENRVLSGEERNKQREYKALSWSMSGVQ